MYKIGIIFTGYNTQDTLLKSINPWVKAKRERLHDSEILISAVSLPFKGYEDLGVVRDSTTETLKKFKENGDIDYLICEPEFITEAEARTLASAPLMNDHVDLIWLVDSDEVYTHAQIKKILDFIYDTPLVTWYKLSFKNFIFDEKSNLKEPFCPPRVFKTKNHNLTFLNFNYDNDATYQDSKGIYHQHALPCLKIPSSVAYIKHYTWLNNERTKNKIKYQKIRWGEEGCSYDWDEKENKVKFNLNYFKKHNLPIPEIETRKEIVFG